MKELDIAQMEQIEGGGDPCLEAALSGLGTILFSAFAPISVGFAVAGTKYLHDCVMQLF
jgi:hypothetical protein